MASRWQAVLHAPMRWARGARYAEEQNPATADAPLEYLHAAFAHLLEEPDSTVPFKRLLEQLEKCVSASESAIFVHPEEGGPLTPWAWTTGTDCHRLRYLLAGGSAISLAKGRALRVLPDDERMRSKILVVSLCHDDQRIGFLALKTSASSSSDCKYASVLQKTGSGIAAMIHGARRARINRTAALREERGAIARDLHDSLAQSLSYGKIQVSRLQALSRSDRKNNSPWHSMEMDSVIQELRSNLNMAYRQLRELITTCRLTMDGRDLDQALEDSIEEFGKRSGIAFELDNRVAGIPLNANEAMHVLHIVREALSNIVRHSHARHATVRLFSAVDGRVSIIISDDGTGLAPVRSNDPHHGLMIMQERAHRLDGNFIVASNDHGGTRVSIRFMPKSAADGQVAPPGRTLR